MMDRRDARIVDADELRFDHDELLAVFGGPVTRHLEIAALRLLADRCGGWPAAIDRTARRLPTAFEVSDPARHELVGRLIRDPVDLCAEFGLLLDAVPSDELRRSVIELAGLPGFDDEMCREIGLVAGVDAVRDLGVPVEEAGAGLWAVAEPLRALLAPDALDAAFAGSAARRYLELDPLDAALQVLAAGAMRMPSRRRWPGCPLPAWGGSTRPVTLRRWGPLRPLCWPSTRRFSYGWPTENSLPGVSTITGTRSSVPEA